MLRRSMGAPPNLADRIQDRIRGWADRLAEQPAAFHWLRKLPEANYRATKARIRAVRDALGQPRVLDAGCGTGEYSELFDPARYLGVDLHPGYVAFARRRHPRHRYEVADLRRWSGGGGFDLVLVNGVLHHLGDDDARALLATAAHERAPGGALLVIEDVALPRPGLGTRLVHALDHGDFIRDAARWSELVSSVAPIARSETYRSGVCPYHLMLCAQR
jgi:SAM-dependent methyltransferase